ncbi:hypothetical protein B0O80DRAFT_500657 [Mortierella sp. GBAus27b]|nr:hypothetical protein B0O80DRAFT_500657 [Mortierella sp. GBAus27b]
MSSRYLMLIATIPVCYFAGYAYREYYDPDETATTLNRKPESLSDNLITNRLKTLEESKLKVLKQLEEVEAHREKLKVAGKNVTDIPGRLW